MATTRSQEDICSLVEDVTLQLEVEAGSYPYYRGLVLTADMLMVINGRKLQLHSRHDGKLMARPHRLESDAVSMCLINNKEVAAFLGNSAIEILSFEPTYGIKLVKRFRVTTELYGCDAVAKVESMDKLIVSGCKLDGMSLCLYWCVVSLTDGYVDTIHQICKVGFASRSHLATNKDCVFISYNAGHDSPDTAVYSYYISNPSTRRFMYRHSDLKEPKGLTVDTRGYIFVCNESTDYSIHQLTEKGELVTIHRLSSSPCEIFYDEQEGLVYIIHGLFYRGNNEVIRYRLEYSHQQDPVIPAEVLNMDAKSLHMYKNALRDGKEKVYSIRVMVVGQYGVGKTTLTKRLLGKEVQMSHCNSTEGIDVHTECCKVSMATREWITQEKNEDQYSRLQRLVKLLNERPQKQEHEGESDEKSEMSDQFTSREWDDGHPQYYQPVSVEQNISPEVKSPFSQPNETPVVNMGKESSSKVESSENDTDSVIEILQLVNKNSDKLEKNKADYAALSMWDFAGQYVFYTTHQTFLTNRAIYILVIDLNQQVTDLIEDDECFLDTVGIKRCKVHDFVEIWMNSIHSCASSTQDGVPPVILVGTHLDKIPEKFRQKVVDRYFLDLYGMLKGKPILLHLKGDIAIDNTKCDPKLKDLKEMIFDLASKQTHWGEEKPARWVPLEQAIMNLKASGIKVASLNLIEDINKSGSVRIEEKNELDLFLRLQHEIGMILYFSIDGLRGKVILDPQWLIDALKSLITAEMFVRKNPVIVCKWIDFKEKGILSQELIDTVWTKEQHPDLHANKDHILMIMEHLNIIAKPRSFSKTGVKEEDYYIAPCMLRQATPEAIICPDSNDEMESTSVFCLMCTGKFLPSPIFHRLVGACLAHWAIAEQNSDNLIYCGCCVFDLDHFHRLTLYFRDYAIFIRITRMAVTDMTGSSKLCSEARIFIFDNLRKIIGILGKSIEFEPYIQCPNSKAGSLEGLIPLPLIHKNERVVCHSHEKSHTLVSQELCKFWFEEESQTVAGGIDAGSKSTVQQAGAFHPTEQMPSTSRKLHRTVLNRCLPVLMEDLDVRAVTMYIQQKELFADVTVRDILEQRTTSGMISELITLIKQRDQTTYAKFKECLVLAKQADLKDRLEEEEINVAKEITESQEARGTALSASNLETRPRTPVALTTMKQTTQSPKYQTSTTKPLAKAASTTNAPATGAPTTSAQTTQSPKVQISTTKVSSSTASTTKKLATAAPTSTALTTRSLKDHISTANASATAGSMTMAVATTAPTTAAQITPSPKIQTSATKAPTTAASATKTLATAAPTTMARTFHFPKVETSRTKASTTVVSTTKTVATTTPANTAQTSQFSKDKTSVVKLSTTHALMTKAVENAVTTMSSKTIPSPKEQAPKTRSSKSATSTTKPLSTTELTTMAQTTQFSIVQTSTSKASTTDASTTRKAIAPTAHKTTTERSQSPKFQTATHKASKPAESAKKTH